MKKNKIYSWMLLLLIALLSLGLGSCSILDGLLGQEQEDNTGDINEPEMVDYVSNLQLDMNSDSKKAEVTVKQTVDGDTVHFNISDPTFEGSVIKARFLAVNTPESTGQVEPYGKKASNFTKEKVLNASSIIIESDDANWNADSTGGRYLLWIWYRTDDSQPYRNLNLELLQNGLAIASNTGQNRYGKTCLDALAQAKTLKLNCFSGKNDPDFYYGEAIELTLKELRTNIEKYNGKRVAFEGTIYRDENSTIYVEDYSAEDGIYYGIQVYYGYGVYGVLAENISVGNRARIVCTITYYEAGGVYQGSDLKYREMKPNDPNNTQFVSSGHSGGYPVISLESFKNDKVDVLISETNAETGEETEKIESRSLAEMIIHSSIQMNNLEVVDIYTTNNEESSSNGAMTLTCKVGNLTIKVRTAVLRDADGKLITASAFQGKNISVKGMVDYYDGTYQIKVFNIADVTFNN